MSRPVRCIHCRERIHTTGTNGGTRWVHEDGDEQCRPTYAAPSFEGQP